MAYVGSAWRAVLLRSAFAFVAAVAVPECANAQSIYLPSIKIGTAALIAPADANAYYGTSTTSSDGLGGITGNETPVPPEITELNRALKMNADLIYQYVHNNIQTVWMYGLQKGALGAEIDKSGTPFDQAELMVALLRQAGYTTSYVAGTISLNNSQFNAWTGITNARAACQLLANGGIPAKVDGTGDTACSNIDPGLQVSAVEMAHIWVRVTMSGCSPSPFCVFDPSYKVYNWKTGLNLASAMHFTSGDPLHDATTGGGYTSGTDASGAPWASAYNASGTSGLNPALQGYASQLLSTIKSSNMQGAQIEDIVGGGVIVPDNSTLRQTALPYIDPSPPYTPHVWTPSAGDTARYNAIPDQYRTTLTVEGISAQYTASLGLQDVEMFTQIPTFFADEIYGRRLTMETDFSTAGIHVQPDYGPQNACLALDAQDDWSKWPSSHCLSAALTYNYPPPPVIGTGSVRGLPVHIKLTVNHPYSASANGSATTNGDYMDATLDKHVGGLVTPLTIVHGWGDVSQALFAKWSGERASDSAAPNSLQYPRCKNDPGDGCPQLYLPPTNNFAREKLAAGWLAQFTRAARLNAAIANSVSQVHHVLGFVYGDTNLQGVTPRVNTDAPDYVLGDNFDRIDVDAGISLTSKVASTPVRRAALQAFAASSATLEGSMAAQLNDLPDTSSTATRFEWGNSPDSDHSAGGQNPYSMGPQRFYQFVNGQASAVPGLMTFDGAKPTDSSSPTCKGSGSDSWSQPPTFTQTNCTNETSSLASWITSYAGQGFTVVASSESYLGPGQRGGTIYPTLNNQGRPTSYSHDPSKQRGGAFVAIRIDSNGDPTDIAHVIVSGDLVTKGGGGGSQPDDHTNYDPSEAADVLKSRFADRSKLLGVDLSNGSLGTTSPVSISIGSGAFPYEMSANLSWHPGAPPAPWGMISPIAPQAGWNNNWVNELSLSGSGMEAMGASDVRGAIGAIVSLYAAQDIFQTEGTDTLDGQVAAVLTEAWWSHQMSGNVASVNVGGRARQFVKIATGNWIAPGSGFASFAQTNARVPYEQKCFHIYVDTPPYALSRGWDASSVSFALTSAQGDAQNFGFFDNPYHTDPSRVCGQLRGFRLTSWTFPYGMQVTPTYTPVLDADGDAIDYLTAAGNSVGRSLTINTTSITAGARSITFSDSSTTPAWMKDALLNQTSFTYQPKQAVSSTLRPVPWPLLASVTTPEHPADPNLEYGYDALGRIDQVMDAVAIQNKTRGPYNFFLADGTRGERDDPLGQSYTVVYDTYGHPSRYIDEVGAETDALIDSRGRPLQYVYPEGDCEAFAYDDQNNTTDLWKVDKTSSCNTTAGTTHVLHVSAVWDQTWNKPHFVTDARGNMTELDYLTTSPGTSLLGTAKRPTINEGTPVYQFDYDTKGRLADMTGPTGIVTHNIYDTNENLTSTTVDYNTGTGHLNLKTQFGYDVDGNVNQTTDPNLNVTSTAWDANRRRVEDDHHDTATTLNAAEKTLYDAVNRVTDAQVGTVFSGTTVTTWLTTKHTTYTPTSTVATVTDADNRTTTTSYDDVDRILTVTDPVSRKVHYTYCGAGEPNCAANAVEKELRAWSATNACSVSGTLQECYRRLTYFPDGEERSIQDANGNTTNYAYDGWNRLMTTTFPDTTFEQLGLDANGNVTSRENRAGQTLTYQYNALNWMTQKVSPSPAVTTSWGYLLDGRIDSLSDTASFLIDYGYDTAGRMNQIANRIDGLSGTHTVNYQLDANGNRTQLAWPAVDGAYAVNYCYDNLNRMVKVQENATDCASHLLATYAHDPQSRRTSVTYGNGASVTYPSYTNAGDLQTLTENFIGTSSNNTFSYTYTNAHQTLTTAATNSAFFWQPSVNNSTSYTPNNLNQYSAIGSQTTGGTNCQGAAQGLSYDCNGNLTFDGTNTYTYDAENRLTKATHSGLNAKYEYDPLGRRTKKSGTGVTTTFYLSDGADEIAEYDGTDNITTRYVPGPAVDEPIIVVTAATGAKEYFHTDKRGSIVAMSDTFGNLVEGPYTYDAYGNCFVGLTACGTSGEPYRFTGRRFDPETGLYYYRARYYDPVKGRFLQADPIGYQVDLNLYAYVGNDPTDQQDPTGMTNNCGTGNTGSHIPGQSGGHCEGEAKYTGDKRSAELARSKQGGGSKPPPSTGPAGVVVASEPGSGGDSNGSLPEGGHDYSAGPHVICEAQWHCSAELVGKTYSKARNAIPGNPIDAPIVSGTQYYVYLFGIPMGIVTSNVGQGGLTISNVTELAHPLCCGWISRDAYESNGAWYSVTHGSGISVYGGAFTAAGNDVLGPYLFDGLDASVRDQLYSATHP
jgi:RHS repeat-associated protein